MAHLIIGLYAPPDIHEKFMSDVNNWRYEVEGRFRAGRVAPFVSELKMYDIRLPEDIIPPFLRDMKSSTPEGLFEHIAAFQSGKGKVLKFLFNMFKKYNPLKPAEKADGPSQHNLGSWSNAYVIGKVDDDGTKSMFDGKMREVL